CYSPLFLHAALPICEREDSYALPPTVGANGATRVVPVHSRHADVHQDCVGPKLVSAFQRFDAVARNRGLVAAMLEQLGERAGRRSEEHTSELQSREK